MNVEGWTPVKNTKKLHYFRNPNDSIDTKFSLCGKYHWDDSLKAFIKGNFNKKSYCEICLKKLS